jgi:hypothetical protein
VDPFAIAGAVDVEVPVQSHALVVQPTGSVAMWFDKLCTVDVGVLYEDPYLQVCFCSKRVEYGRVQQSTESAVNQSVVVARGVR